METTQRLKDLAVSESGFIFDPYSGGTFTVNDTAIAILEGLREGLDREEVIATLREEFDVGSSDDLDRDLDEFIGMLRQQGIVDQDFSL